jgi:ribosomal protein L34E
MKKNIIRCDICGKELDYKKDSTYYTINECNTPGWAGIDYTMGFETKFDLCKECFEPLNLIEKKRKLYESKSI